LGNEYSRTIEPARAIATETLTLTRTLSDLVNHACAGNDEPRLPGLRAFKYCVVFRVALYNLKDTSSRLVQKAVGRAGEAADAAGTLGMGCVA
jgi:hypothetical protein